MIVECGFLTPAKTHDTVMAGAIRAVMCTTGTGTATARAWPRRLSTSGANVSPRSAFAQAPYSPVVDAGEWEPGESDPEKIYRL